MICPYCFGHPVIYDNARDFGWCAGRHVVPGILWKGRKIALARYEEIGKGSKIGHER